MARHNRTLSYENLLLILMSLAMGFVALDRSAIGYLSPFIIAEFHLNNTELGLISSAFSTTAAVSGVALSALADQSGKRKHFFLAAFALFAAFSAAAGLATTFMLLLATRLVTGIAAGPLVPTGQSILYLASSPHRRGFNMGFIQTLGVYLIGMMLGPIICTQIGTAFGWRNAFFLSGIPAALIFLPLIFLIKNPPQPVDSGGDARSFLHQVRELLASRNLLLCLLIASMFSSWLLVQFTFMPRYLTEVDGMSPADAGLLMSLIGISGAIGGVLVSALSDRFGRKPTLAIAAFGGIIAPLALFTIRDQVPLLAVGIFVGWLASSAGPLYLAIIPTESVPARLAASAVAVTLGVGEVVGGIIAPAAAGVAADRFGLHAPFVLSIFFALASGAFALFLRETAPARQSPDKTVGVTKPKSGSASDSSS